MKYKLIFDGKFYHLLINEQAEIGDWCFSRYGAKLLNEELKFKLDQPAVFEIGMRSEWYACKIIATTNVQLPLPELSIVGPGTY